MFEHEKLVNANDKTNEEVMYNQNVIEKIFNLMETFSWQMLKMEERIK